MRCLSLLSVVLSTLLLTGCMTTRTIPVVPPVKEIDEPKPLLEPVVPPTPAPDPSPQVQTPPCPGPLRWLERDDHDSVFINKEDFYKLLEHLNALHEALGESLGQDEYPQMRIIKPPKDPGREVY